MRGRRVYQQHSAGRAHKQPDVGGHPLASTAGSAKRQARKPELLPQAGPVTRQQAATRQTKRSRTQLEAVCSTTCNSSVGSRAGFTSQARIDVPIAKRTRSFVRSGSPEGNHSTIPPPVQQPGTQQQEQRVGGASTTQQQQRSQLFQIADDIRDRPRRHENLPRVLAGMLDMPDNDDYQLIALDAALAVEKISISSVLKPFLTNQQLLPHLLRLVMRSSERWQEGLVAQAAHTVLCWVACRAARQSAAAADAVLQVLLSNDQQGLLYLLQQTPSSDHSVAHAALAAIASLASTARFAGPASAAATVVQQLYSIAMRHHAGFQLLLESLQQEHLGSLAAFALEGFSQTVPQQLLADLLSPQHRRRLQYYLDALNSPDFDVYGPLREATYLIMVAATAAQLQQMLRLLMRQVQRHSSVSAMQLIVLAGVHAGPAALIPHSRMLLELLGEHRGSPDYKQYMIRALQQIAQTDAEQQLLIQQGIPALLHSMEFCELDTAVAAASLICMLAGSVAGRAALVPHIQGLLSIAALQRRSDITGIAVQCVGAILVFGSLGADGNLLLSPESPGLTEIVQNVDLVLAVMQQECLQRQQSAVAQQLQQQEEAHHQQQQQQQAVDLPQQQEQAEHVQPQQQQDGGQDPEQPQQAPQIQQQPTADQPPPPPPADQQQQQQDQPLLQIRPCASVSAAMIVNAIAVSPQGLQALQQEQYLDRLLSVVQHRGPAATLAARAISQVIATAPASRQVLVAPHRLAVIHSLAADVPKIAELGSRAAAAGPAALAAALAALNGDQDAAADVFRVAGPLVHLLTAAAACGVVPQYVDGLARIIHRVPCLTMVIFEALTHLATFRDGVLAVAPHIYWIAAAVQHSMRGPAGSAEAATVAGTASIAAVRGSFDKQAAARAARNMVTAVEAVLRELKQEQVAAEGRMQYAAVQLAAAMKRYRRWPRNRKLQATVTMLLQYLGRVSEVNSQLKHQLQHIKFCRQPEDGYGTLREEVRVAMGGVSNH